MRTRRRITVARWRDGDVSVQAIAGGENQSAKIQRSGRGSDDVCERDKQTEQPWSARQTTPSVAVTWGWGSSALTADLGNNASLIPTSIALIWIFHCKQLMARSIGDDMFI